ncbi:hypothetical protein MNBD_GAMMA11-3241 [hydrothermal vent metagenome]|uniref:Uncharacterized protein n=1 Tax=hydrothermal vent metagenome TaxID=652676 RepID=A0A3B0WRS6_9ZZZZ
MITRRRLLTTVTTTLAGLTAGLVTARQASAETVGDVEVMRFPGDPTDHNVVYQFNKAEQSYHNGVLFSVAEVLRKYNDNVTIVVTAIGPGLHILAKKPLRTVSEHTKEKVKSLADYGIRFHACGNTMKSLNWTKDDLHDFVEVVNVGAVDLMELQEQGYSYISW